jgi:hypothetical protein
MANIAMNNTARRGLARWIDGEAITQGLRAFNNWRDDFLIELTTLLLMVGFVVGTIDVLTSGGLSQIGFINYAWAVVQAVAIDGLFFAVWGKIRRLEWTWRLVFNNVMLITVGLLLAVVAALVNNILGYEELNHVATLADVMAKLGVDATVFSYVRSTLVVLVSILVALFARSHGPSLKQLLATIAQHEEDAEGLRAMRDMLVKERDSQVERAMIAEKERNGLRANVQVLQDEKAILSATSQATIEAAVREKEGLQSEIARLREELSVVRQRARNREIAKATPTAMTTTNNEHSPVGQATKSNKDTGYMARDNGVTMAIANDQGDTIIATGSHRERIKEAMATAIAQGQDFTYQDIADAINVGYSTVKKYAKEIREEIAREQTGEMEAIEGTVEE